MPADWQAPGSSLCMGSGYATPWLRPMSPQRRQLERGQLNDDLEQQRSRVQAVAGITTCPSMIVDRNVFEPLVESDYFSRKVASCDSAQGEGAHAQRRRPWPWEAWL